MKIRSSAEGLAGAFLYGDVDVDAWAAPDSSTAGEPWTAFERARALARAGKADEAADIWSRIAITDGLESRHTLQAWHFLRQAGRTPTAERASTVLGVVIEMPVAGVHDVLAAYADGSARYFNHSGSSVVVEDRSDTEISEAARHWIEVGTTIARIIGPWDAPTFPPLGPGEARVVMLTPSGPHFGQGPAQALSADPMAGAFIQAATTLFQLITARTNP